MQITCLSKTTAQLGHKATDPPSCPRSQHAGQGQRSVRLGSSLADRCRGLRKSLPPASVCPPTDRAGPPQPQNLAGLVMLFRGMDAPGRAGGVGRGCVQGTGDAGCSLQEDLPFQKRARLATGEPPPVCQSAFQPHSPCLPSPGAPAACCAFSGFFCFQGLR